MHCLCATKNAKSKRRVSALPKPPTEWGKGNPLISPDIPLQMSAFTHCTCLQGDLCSSLKHILVAACTVIGGPAAQLKVGRLHSELWAS